VFNLTLAGVPPKKLQDILTCLANLVQSWILSFFGGGGGFCGELHLNLSALLCHLTTPQDFWK